MLVDKRRQNRADFVGGFLRVEMVAEVGVVFEEDGLRDFKSLLLRAFEIEDDETQSEGEAEHGTEEVNAAAEMAMGSCVLEENQWGSRRRQV